MGIMCPTKENCEYDTVVDMISRIMGYDYIGGLLGSEQVASNGSQMAIGSPYATLIAVLGGIILSVIIFAVFMMFFLKLFRVGVSGRLGGEQESGWTYFKPLLAVILVAPVGAYPLIVGIVTTIALIGNGIANHTMGEIVNRQIDAYSMTDVSGSAYSQDIGLKRADIKQNPSNIRNQFKNNESKQLTPALMRLRDANNLQSFMLYGAIHGACVSHLERQGYVANPYVKSSSGQKDGKINLTYYNVKDFKDFDGTNKPTVNKTGFWGRITGQNQFGVNHGFCGTVDFDFFTSNEFKSRYEDFFASTITGFKATQNLGSDAKAKQSQRTERIQQHLNGIIQSSALVSAKVNNLRSAYAVNAYLTGFMRAGGSAVQEQCNAILDQVNSHLEDQFKTSSVIKPKVLGVNVDVLGFINSNNKFNDLTGFSSTTSMFKTTLDTNNALKGGNPCSVSSSGWAMVGEDSVDASTGSTQSSSRTFDGVGLIQGSIILEQDLIKKQIRYFDENFRKTVKEHEQNLKEEYKTYLVGRGWANIAEGTILLRNIDNSTKGLYFIPVGSASILVQKQVDESDKEAGRINLNDYNTFNQDYGVYVQRASSALASNSPMLHPSVSSEFKIISQVSDDSQMGNVLDGVVQTSWINDMERSLLNTMTEGRLQDDPIGAMVSMGNNARMTSLAVEALGATIAGSGGNAVKAVVSFASYFSPIASMADKLMDKVQEGFADLVNGLNRTGYYLGTIVPTIPSVVMIYAVIGYLMALFLTQVGAMLWLLMQAHPNPVTGTTQQLITSLLTLLFRPFLIVTGFYLSMLLLSSVIGLIFEVWFSSKTLMTAQTDSSITEGLMTLITFKESFEFLGLLFTGATILCLSWVNEFYDSTASALGTNLYHQYADLNTNKLAHVFVGGMATLGQKLGRGNNNDNGGGGETPESDGGGDKGGKGVAPPKRPDKATSNNAIDVIGRGASRTKSAGRAVAGAVKNSGAVKQISQGIKTGAKVGGIKGAIVGGTVASASVLAKGAKNTAGAVSRLPSSINRENMAKAMQVGGRVGRFTVGATKTTASVAGQFIGASMTKNGFQKMYRASAHAHDKADKLKQQNS